MAVQVEACVGCVNGKAAWSLFSKKAIDPSFKVSRSLGTVSLDKPQILPYPCIKRKTSPKLGILVFQGDFFTGSAKQI